MNSLSLARAALVINLLGCADTLPESIADYAERCVKMNSSLLPERDDDPHRGEKNVYACGVESQELQANTRPFPDGTWMVKESIRKDASFPWLVATAEKRSGQWHWNEYSRNFAEEPLVSIFTTESTCTGCHRRVQTADWIFTVFDQN